MRPRVNDFSTIRNRPPAHGRRLGGTARDSREESRDVVVPGPAAPLVRPRLTESRGGGGGRAIAERVSLGVACCRIRDGRPEILIVCKRYTYAYNMFVRGKYNSNDNDSIIRLFDGMTVDEKNDVLSLNFAQIWYRIWFSNTTVGRQETTGYAPAGFVVAKSKFENTFLIDRGEKLRKLLGCSKINAARIWEIPKGKKKNRNEADIHCAVREFYEETGVEKKSYKLFPNVRKQSYIDDGVQYTNIYYIAMACHNIAPRIDFNKQSQLEEVADIRWANSDALKTLDESGRLHKFVKPIFNFIKKHAR